MINQGAPTSFWTSLLRFDRLHGVLPFRKYPSIRKECEDGGRLVQLMCNYPLSNLAPKFQFLFTVSGNFNFYSHLSNLNFSYDAAWKIMARFVGG